jgi:hypoxanthine-DNA glycosylase
VLLNWNNQYSSGQVWIPARIFHGDIMQEQFISHPIPPTWNEHSEILILGSFPSVKSREAAYFYGHPQNRFWRVLAALFEESVPETKEERKAFLLRHHIAVWDVIASCEIYGSSDASIRNAVPNDLRQILDAAQIRQIYVNGQTAGKLYRKYQEKTLCQAYGDCTKAVILPSTSPANAAWNIERLRAAWSVILEPLGKTPQRDDLA